MKKIKTPILHNNKVALLDLYAAGTTKASEMFEAAGLKESVFDKTYGTLAREGWFAGDKDGTEYRVRGDKSKIVKTWQHTAAEQPAVDPQPVVLTPAPQQQQPTAIPTWGQQQQQATTTVERKKPRYSNAGTLIVGVDNTNRYTIKPLFFKDKIDELYESVANPHSPIWLDSIYYLSPEHTEAVNQIIEDLINDAPAPVATVVEEAKPAIAAHQIKSTPVPPSYFQQQHQATLEPEVEEEVGEMSESYYVDSYYGTLSVDDFEDVAQDLPMERHPYFIEAMALNQEEFEENWYYAFDGDARYSQTLLMFVGKLTLDGAHWGYHKPSKQECVRLLEDRGFDLSTIRLTN